jgi:carbon monoxide dehydrogenase subunit G
MQFSQAFSVPFPRLVVWSAFQDLESVARCMPGAQLTEPPKDGQILGQVTIKLGPIVAAFAGQGEVRFDPASFTGEIAGAGTDRKSASRAKGTARFVLTETQDGTATDVKVDVDYQLTGALGQFGRASIVQDLAARLTQTFAENLRREISALSAAVPSSSEAVALTPASSAAQGARSLDLGSLIWAVVRGWLGRLFSPRH